ncbi:MAG: hypothetical protein JXR97_00715 [Planctomycetes bacterium]|nr:hypothetical protein [Planctomycetota bacterium]
MAKKFDFRLQPVLRYREMIEKEKMKDFAIANREVDEQVLHMNSMQDERDSTQDEVREIYAKNESFDKVVEHYRFINAVDLQLAMGARKLKKLETVRDDKMRVFINSRKDRRALELLKDKKKEEHDYDVSCEVQHELDELSIRAKRRRDEEESKTT